MDEEEKKAIETLKEFRKKGFAYLMVETNFDRTKANTKLEIAFDTILNLIEKQQKEIEELKKYDYRNIKINKHDEINSIHFTKEQLDLMNLGIALYIGIPKLLTDIEDEETDI